MLLIFWIPACAGMTVEQINQRFPKYCYQFVTPVTVEVVSQDCAQQGCCAQAPMEGFTAGLEKRPPLSRLFGTCGLIVNSSHFSKHNMHRRIKYPLPGISPLLLGFCLLCLFTSSHALTPTQQDINIDEQNSLTAEVYSDRPRAILIWQPHELGIQTIDRQFATALAKQGIETWLVDMLEANFLPNTASNMDRISGKEVVALLDTATKSGLPVFVAASGRGAVPMLRGVRLWQLAQAHNQQLAGVILLSPNLYVETPDPGVPAAFMPIATATNARIIILQPDKSPWYWKLNSTVHALEQQGSDVFSWPWQNVRDRFYFRPDATEYEIAQSQLLANRFNMAINLFLRSPSLSRAGVIHIAAAPPVGEGKKDRALQAYQGDPQPPALRLPQLDGRMLDLNDLKGKVVLVNFWATWCPPCVHEMPSMQRLQDTMQGKAFTILGVNMAEDDTSIKQFLQSKVSVNFPIILDRDGRALQNWGVFAFPTSYVIDKQGKIRYALFGSVEWDNAAIVNKLSSLLQE